MPFSRTYLLLGLLCRLICTVKKNDKLKKHYEALKTNNHCTKHAHISHPHAGLSQWYVYPPLRSLYISEAPEILRYKEMSGVNISSEPVLKIQM